MGGGIDTSATPATLTPSTTLNQSPSTSGNQSPNSSQPPHQSGPAAPASQSKKFASLFTWLTLQSIPEETVICPHILDFLELALEPLPPPQPQKTPSDNGDANQDGK